MKIRKGDGASNSSSGFLSTLFAAIFGKTLSRQVGTVVAVAVAIFAYVLYSSGSGAIRDLSNADPEVLKDAFFGEKPHLFYCERGNGGNKVGTIPKIFSDLNVIKGNKINFASVNCSQVLPSGKDIWDRFKLKKEWKPTIFGTAPWTKAIQAHPTNLKDVTALKKFVDDELSAKATVVKSDKQLWQHCAFQKNLIYDDRDISDTCFVIVKGSKFVNSNFLLEQRLVQQYPRSKFASVDANKHRLSFEDADALPADHFAMKIHALRNGTHYMTMVNPTTWDYMNAFVSSALASPLYDFSGEGNAPLALMKLKDLQAKKLRAEKKKNTQTTKPRTTTKPVVDVDEEDDEDVDQEEQQRARATKAQEKRAQRSAARNARKKDEAKPKPTEEATTDNTNGDAGLSEAELKEAEAKAELLRRERERARREEMERQEREYLFETIGAADETEENAEEENKEEEEDEDDSVIEL